MVAVGEQTGPVSTQSATSERVEELIPDSAKRQRVQIIFDGMVPDEVGFPESPWSVAAILRNGNDRQVELPDFIEAL